VRSYVAVLIVLALIFGLHGCSQNGANNSSEEPSGEETELQKLSEEIANDPANVSALYNRARIYYDEGNYGDAIFDLAAAMKVDSINEQYHHLLADSYLGALKSEYALLTMERALKLFPESMPTLLKAAELQIVLKQYDQASATLQRALEQEPRNTEALYLVGLMLYEQGNLERAIQSFQTVVEIDSENKEAWTMLGNLYDMQNDPLALQCFDNAISIDSAYMPGLHSKAYYLQNHGRIDEALDIYHIIEKKDSTYGDAYLNAGILYIEKEDFTLAENELSRLAELQQNNPLAPFYLGVISEQRGDYQKALGFYNQAASLSPRDTRYAEAVERMKIQLDN